MSSKKGLLTLYKHFLNKFLTPRLVQQPFEGKGTAQPEPKSNHNKRRKRDMKHIRTIGIAALTALALNITALKANADDKDIVGVASANGSFKTLVAAVKAAGLVETLQGKGPFTVFAPTDEAFGKLPAGTVESLLKPENKEKLVGILTYHVVSGKVMAADVKSGMVKTVNGKELTVKAWDGKVSVDGAKVTAADVAASNGVIHVIDTVVLPK